MTAGAIAVPTIVPLRAPFLGQQKGTIDTNTKIELRSETPGVVIYYTLNGAKPMPFAQFGPDARATLLYRSPFTMPSGKHVVKAVAVFTDDHRESFVVTKAFDVEQVPPAEGVDVEANELHYMHDVAVTDNMKRDIQKFSNKFAGTAKKDWSDNKFGSESERGELSSRTRKQPGPRFLNSRLGNVSERSMNGRSNETPFVVNGNDTHSNRKAPPNDAMQSMRLQRETDFLKCVYCFTPRPADPFVRFCTTCGNPVPPMPQSRLPPPEAGQMGPCVSCKAVVPLNTPHCLVCEAPMNRQNVPQASVRLADKLLCIVCGTANPSNLTSCVTCDSSLLANTSKLVTQKQKSVVPPPPSINGTVKGFSQCSNCGRTNSPEARFCDWCGTKPISVPITTLTCSSCRASNNPYSQFCGGCGLVLMAPSRTDLVAQGYQGYTGDLASQTSTPRAQDEIAGKTAQWMPVSSGSFQLRTEASTQTVGLFYPSQRTINQNHEELDQKLDALRKMQERRPVVLTAVSPGKGYWRKQMEHICEHLKAHAANSADFRNLIKDPKMGKLLEATVSEDGYELSLTVNFALRDGDSASQDGVTGGKLPTGTSYRESASFSARRGSLTRYASQDSLDNGDYTLSQRSAVRKKTRKPTTKKVAIDSELTEEDRNLLREIGKNGEGRSEEVQQLIDEGANPNCVSKDGFPALHVAVINGHVDAIPVLVQAGAQVNASGPSSGNTALHEAVGLGPSRCDVIDTLLGCGANSSKKNDKGETPYDLAVKHGHEVVIKKFASVIGKSSLDKLTRPKGLSANS